MIPERYNLENLKNAILNPERFVDESRRVASKFPNQYNKFQMGPGDDFLDEEWDNLIILDACRSDALKQVNWLDGNMETRISKGSNSKEFIQKSFAGRELHNTVYITANPYFALLEPDVFHAVISLLEDWDEDNQTVMPKTVKNRVKDVYNEYEDKKLIIHFMQPHQPYLGEKASEIKSKINSIHEFRGWKPEARTSWDHGVGSFDGITHSDAVNNPNLDITRDDIWKAYLETLQIVLKEVESLHQILGGRTVITADHGEMLGERPNILSGPKYGHPSYSWTKELRTVPWFVIESATRRDVIAEAPNRYDTIDENQLTDKLEALGYK